MLLLAHIDEYAGQVPGPVPDLGQDFLGRAPFLPIDEFERNGADDVLGFAAVALAASPRVDRFELAHAQHARFHLAHEGVLLVNGQVAARLYLDLSEVGLYVGEELDPLAVVGVDHLNTDQ